MNPVFPPIIRGIQDAAEALGYTVITANTDDEEMKERDLKKKISDVRIEVVPFEGRTQKMRDLHEEDTNLVKLFPKGALEVSFEADSMAGKEVTLSTKDEDLGKLTFQQNKMLYHGFQAFWWPVPKKTAEEDCRLVIEIR